MNKVLAIIVTYNPDENFKERAKLIASQVNDLLIFDNSEESSVSKSIRDAVNELGAKYIGFNENKGISAALNYGAQYAINNGYSFYITFDQDTCINNGFVKNLREIIQCDNSIGAIGPTYIDVNDNRYARFPKVINGLIRRITLKPEDKVTDVLCIITSGTIYNVKVFSEAGFFKDKYFIDYVDNEFCLRIINSGYRVCVNPKVVIHHALGERTKKFIFSPTNHSALRKYYATRNRIDVWKTYAFKFPSYVIYDLSAFILDLIRVALCEEDKMKKLSYMAKGILDCLSGKFGRN